MSENPADRTKRGATKQKKRRKNGARDPEPPSTITPEMRASMVPPEKPGHMPGQKLETTALFRIFDDEKQKTSWFNLFARARLRRLLPAFALLFFVATAYSFYFSDSSALVAAFVCSSLFILDMACLNRRVSTCTYGSNRMEVEEFLTFLKHIYKDNGFDHGPPKDLEHHIRADEEHSSEGAISRPRA